MGEEVLLQMTDISKSFPGVKALDHVSLTVRRGTVHAVSYTHLTLPTILLV